MQQMLGSICLLIFFVPAMAGAVEEAYFVGKSLFSFDTGKTACAIMRFRAHDGSYTLKQADQLYDEFDTFLRRQLAYKDASYLPPEWHKANGISGVDLSKQFIEKGQEACRYQGDSVNLVLFVSSFRCEYQNEKQMCFRLYIDADEEYLDLLKIPEGVMAIGGFFVKREIWDNHSPLLLTNQFGDVFDVLEKSFPRK